MTCCNCHANPRQRWARLLSLASLGFMPDEPDAITPPEADTQPEPDLAYWRAEQEAQERLDALRDLIRHRPIM
ncbi:hypothetical protein [Silvimonas iriomotensis]|uniref:Uncharacterized protein n=1 Tax=Silvimonas iriomotensis TaxID=449662 RepID=A0ABQ2PB29_9NEIS|nr:hypothetical protein [Silvimonas iriomotensis]GGP22744.1 hypothetical protein GCM10010970_27440 [Silvimonas iriomotensis]